MMGERMKGRCAGFSVRVNPTCIHGMLGQLLRRLCVAAQKLRLAHETPERLLGDVCIYVCMYVKIWRQIGVMGGRTKGRGGQSWVSCCGGCAYWRRSCA